MTASDNLLRDRVIERVGGSEVPMRIQDVAADLGEPEGPVWQALRDLGKQGFLVERNNGYSYLATPAGRQEAKRVRPSVAAAIVAAMDSDIQVAIREETDAIVASATDILDETNSQRILAELARSSAPLSIPQLATSIGEDQDTVIDLLGSLFQQGLVEQPHDGAAQATQKGRDQIADLTDAEMQEMWSSDRDAVVASTAAMMTMDPADVVFAEAVDGGLDVWAIDTDAALVAGWKNGEDVGIVRLDEDNAITAAAQMQSALQESGGLIAEYIRTKDRSLEGPIEAALEQVRAGLPRLVAEQTLAAAVRASGTALAKAQADQTTDSLRNALVAATRVRESLDAVRDSRQKR